MTDLGFKPEPVSLKAVPSDKFHFIAPNSLSSSTTGQFELTRAEIYRWSSSLLCVLALYGLLSAFWVFKPHATGIQAPPPAAMVVELAPTPVAQKSVVNLPPAPEQLEAAPPPEPNPITKTEPEPPTPAPVVKKAEVAVKKAKSKPEPKTPPPKPKNIDAKKQPVESPPLEKPETTASAPPSAPEKEAQAAAPQQGSLSKASSSNAIPTWHSQVALKLNQAKRYPYRARRLRQEGIAYLQFTMDRNGNVINKSLQSTSGHRLLDKETLAMVERAQPLPKPPQEVEGELLDLVVPVKFSLH